MSFGSFILGAGLMGGLMLVSLPLVFERERPVLSSLLLAMVILVVLAFFYWGFSLIVGGVV